jgi:hypothetical protein
VSKYGFLLLLAIVSPLDAAETGLESLRSLLMGLRKADPAAGLRGATPELTTAKHQLRDWVESRLAAWTSEGDEHAFERELNAELKAAKLTCDEPCPSDRATGYVGELTVRRTPRFVIVQTGLQIQCGFDESAYLYAWTEGKWRRVWQNEQNNYTEKGYRPQRLRAVLISPESPTNDYLVMTLGSESWCTSAWRYVYYRVFRLGPDPEAEPLLDRAETAYYGRRDPGVEGSITLRDILVEFTTGSMDMGVHNRPAVRHYEIKNGAPRRIDPIALKPRDFVDEWINTEWKESVFRTEAEDRVALRELHRTAEPRPVHGEFVYPTTHCVAKPDLWQVGVTFTGKTGSKDAAPLPKYFLVRWRPPYQFTMVGVSDRPSPGCTEKDPQADIGETTMFPVSEGMKRR